MPLCVLPTTALSPDWFRQANTPCGTRLSLCSTAIWGEPCRSTDPLRLPATPPCDEGEPECVYVALANGEWHGNPLHPDSAENLAVALAAIADATQ